MRIAIVGGGNVGRFLAADLQHHHDVVLFERDHELAAHLASQLRCTVVFGDGCELSTLADAGVGTCDVVVASTGDDEDNLVVSLLAKQEFAVPRVIARVNHPKNHWLFNRSWGVDVAVSTPHLISALVEEAVSVGSLVQLLAFDNSGARLVEVTLTATSPAVQRTIATLGLPRDASVVAVVRGENVIVPRGEVTLKPEDHVLCLVVGETEAAVRSVLIGDEDTIAEADAATP
ncbi:TrkA-N domain protein [Acidimicrobium ferrooxidans DSM 10331]|uniref:Trk system potassium uptake protein TrkA n=1 Tax=Acidimicrobium ferrooxidans (strain DSM 10331 / JCM 15462 / NBRC 103882 / ICP) TaxID=525909 RepID=C7M1T1_ACIFD|nr:TrkA family potassium uptake protein [Acidimicrobium ferrooxidans]ACU54828.1 TrkA-N domain protein [Acidimicrobium ferrooxidans DSM 10331]